MKSDKKFMEFAIELAKKGCERFFLISRNKIKSNKFSSFLRLEYNVVVEEKYFDLEKFYDSDQEISYRVSDFDLYIIAAGYLGKNEFSAILSL